MKRNALTYILLLVLLPAIPFVTTGCETTNADDGTSADVRAEEKVETPLRDVRVATARLGDVQETILRVSTLTSPNTVELLPKISGEIVYLNAEEGSRVKAGDVIARLDDQTQRIDVDRALADKKKAEHDRDLAQRQFDAGIIGEEELLQARHAAEQAERELQRTEVEMQKTVLRAPVSGVISQRQVSVGDMVFPSTALATITDLDNLEADILIPQDQIDRVSIGDPVVFYPNGDMDRGIQGTVARISPVIDVETGTIKVTGKVRPGQRGALPGMFVKASVVTGVRQSVVLIPRSAVVVENAMPVIYKVVDGTARRIMIEIGYPSSDGYVQAMGDISAGEPVVISGAAGLDDMVAVRIQPGLDSEEQRADE